MPTGGHAHARQLRDGDYWAVSSPVSSSLHPVALMLKRLRGPMLTDPSSMRTSTARNTNAAPLQHVGQIAGPHQRVNRTDQILQRANDTDRRTTQNTRY